MTHDRIPDALQQALDRGLQVFAGRDGAEWKLEVERNPAFLTRDTGSRGLVFANNGYGDYLFLKANPGVLRKLRLEGRAGT